MIAWALDTELSGHFPRTRALERSLLLYGMTESAIVPLMQDIESRYAGVRTFSLPSVGDGSDGRTARRHIELGVKGAPAQVLEAYEDVQGQLRSLGAEFELLPVPASAPPPA
jgi:molybdopterin-biosynthesis enzyme MoeA-like protein